MRRRGAPELGPASSRSVRASVRARARASRGDSPDCGVGRLRGPEMVMVCLCGTPCTCIMLSKARAVLGLCAMRTPNEYQNRKKPLPHNREMTPFGDLYSKEY